MKNKPQKNQGQKLIPRIELRQKISMNLVLAYVFFGASFIAFLIFIISVSESRKANATPVEIKHVQEQVFINEMSVPAPVISVQGKPDPNTILIQTLKKAPEHPVKKND